LLRNQRQAGDRDQRQHGNRDSREFHWGALNVFGAKISK
jgi:hypothetical protein